MFFDVWSLGLGRALVKVSARLFPDCMHGNWMFPFSCLFGAIGGPRPSVDGLVSVDGLAFPTKTKTF